MPRLTGPVVGIENMISVFLANGLGVFWASDKVSCLGDTTTDLTTAKNAEVDFVGYWRNDRWAQSLIDNGCEKIVKDLWDIVKIASA